MRSILNISVPSSLAQLVKEEVKKGHFASTSEFFRYLVRLWKEQKLQRDIQESEKDFSNGKFKVLKSLKDLR